MPIIYQDPPRIVRPADKDVALAQNAATSMNPEVRGAVSALRQLLNLPLEPEYVLLVQKADSRLVRGYFSDASVEPSP